MGVNSGINGLNVGLEQHTLYSLLPCCKHSFKLFSVMVECVTCPELWKWISRSEKPPLQSQHGVGRNSLLGLLKFVLLLPQGPQHLYRVCFPCELLYSFLPTVKREHYKERINCRDKVLHKIVAGSIIYIKTNCV